MTAEHPGGNVALKAFSHLFLVLVVILEDGVFAITDNCHKPSPSDQAYIMESDTDVAVIMLLHSVRPTPGND